MKLVLSVSRRSAAGGEHVAAASSTKFVVSPEIIPCWRPALTLVGDGKEPCSQCGVRTNLTNSRSTTERDKSHHR